MERKRIYRKKIISVVLILALLMVAVPIAVINANAAVTVITIDRTHTRESIVEMAKALPHSGFNGSKVTRFDEEPSYTAPYSAGSLNADDIADALNALKMVRYLAGVPYENVNFTEELNSIAQHGAVLLTSSNQFSHAPTKPVDMAQDFFDKGYLGCSNANISAGRSNIASSVLGFIADSGESNITRAGHRRWLLKPGGENYGVGYARLSTSSYSGHRINMHVFDGAGPYACEADSYIAWPNAGDFPIQYFTTSTNLNTAPTLPWSINLGNEYQAPVRENIELTLTRERDGKVWVFNESTPLLGSGNAPNDSMHLATDNDGYGMLKAITFRPDVTTLGAIQDGDVFNVSLAGIKKTDGSPVVLEYSINFFDLEKAMASTVAFIDGDATIDEVTVEYQAKVKKPEDPAKTGYTFKGWSTDIVATPDEKDEYDFNTPVLKNMKLYAMWEIITYNITFMDGEDVASDDKAEFGSKIAEPSALEKEGYIFKGWFTDEEGTVPYDFNSLVTDDLILYAKWEKEVSKIVGDADLDGEVGITDVTLIQKYLAKLEDLNDQQKLNADIVGRGDVNIEDATLIQKFLARLPLDVVIGEVRK